MGAPRRAGASSSRSANASRTSNQQRPGIVPAFVLMCGIRLAEFCGSFVGRIRITLNDLNGGPATQTRHLRMGSALGPCRFIQRCAQAAGELQGVVIGPEVHEEEPRLLLQHMAMD